MHYAAWTKNPGRNSDSKNSNTTILPCNYKGDVSAKAILVKNASKHWEDIYLLNIFLQVDKLLVSKLACHGEWYLSVKISCEVVHITTFSLLAIISQDKVSELDKRKCGCVSLHIFVFLPFPSISYTPISATYYKDRKMLSHKQFLFDLKLSFEGEKRAFSNAFRKLWFLCSSFFFFQSYA